MTNTFVSVNNFKDLNNIITEYFKDKSNINVQNISSLNLKKVFYNIIQKVASDPVNQNKSLIEKNKLVLTIVKKIIQEEYKLDTLRDSIHTNRENKVSTHPSQTRTSSEPDNVNIQFGKIVDERANNIDKEIKTLNTNSLLDESISQEDFKSQIESLQNNRSSFDDSLKSLYPNEHNRTFEVSDVINKDYASANTKALYEIDNTPPEKIKNLSLNNTSQIETVISRDNVSTFKKRKTVIIDTSHRNWVNYNSRFDFIINLFANPKQSLSVPYYKNNPTIPFTKTDINNGLPNTNGFKINDTTFEAFDETLNENGNTPNLDNPETPIVLGHETVNIIVDNVSMLSSFKSISSISVANLILPLGVAYKSASTGTNAYEHFNYYNSPYILLCIQELQGTHDGTNNTMSKTFCQLQYKDFVKIDQPGDPSQRGSVIFSPVQHSEKIFFPTPLSSLNSLTVSLHKPSGELLSEELDNKLANDISEIQSTISSSGVALRIKFPNNEGFNVNEFYKNDYVLIKNLFIYAPIDSSLTSTQVSEFNKFISRNTGHRINDINEMDNIIFIDLPSELSEILTNFKLTGIINDFYVFNLSLQYSITFSLEYVENYNDMTI
jgi:hypothetical protein